MYIQFSLNQLNEIQRKIYSCYQANLIIKKKKNIHETYPNLQSL